MTPSIPPVAFIGFGEAAMAFWAGFGGLAPAGARAFDVKSLDPAHARAMASRYADHAIGGADSMAGALDGAGVVFSLVTADQALNAAQGAAPHLGSGCFWFDCNSCAPETKVQAAAVINAAGGRYVDVAVMAPVHPKRHHVPLLVSGPDAADASSVLQALDMRPALAQGPIGAASSIKMLRSVMIKGFEALTSECLLAARRAGVEQQVLASLQASDPYLNWAARGAYNLERMMVHGTRRAAEMREVVITLENLGLPAAMAMATVEWQARVGSMALPGGDDDLALRADRILEKL